MSEPIEQPAEGLWMSLRRRKVVQWGIAYVAGAWGLLQGLAYLSTVFQWSAQLQRPVTMAFLVGLPIALVLAWYHGDRGDQRVSGREFAILTVLLLLGGGLFWWVGRMPAATPATAVTASASAADPRNATAYHWRGIIWLKLGFFERAIADFNHALEVDPSYRNALRHKAVALLWSGKTDEALDLFERGVADGFIVNRAENFVGLLIARGDVLTAQLLLHAMGYAPEVRKALVDALKRPGPPSRAAEEIVERFFASTETPYLVQLGLAYPYLWLGDFAKVGANQDVLSGAIVNWERYPPGFHGSPVFKGMLESSGVLAYWRKHGFPPQCRAVGAKDFTCD